MQALQVPRFCIGPAPTEVGEIALEEGIPEHVRQALAQMGHKNVRVLSGWERSLFGRGQIVQATRQLCSNGGMRRVYFAGSDPRADGLAIGY